jgi:hypothetical protein
MMWGKLPWSRFLSEDFGLPLPVFIHSPNKCSLGVKSDGNLWAPCGTKETLYVKRNLRWVRATIVAVEKQ